LKNQYPEKPINQKINNLKFKELPSSQSKARRNEKLKNPAIVNHTISIPFTSFKCSIIARKMIKILTQYTKSFKLHIAFSTIKLLSVILPRLKPPKSYYQNSNLTYEYVCDEPCEATYIGETQQMLHECILQLRHNKDGTISIIITILNIVTEKFVVNTK
jgi:hypothetical protein